MLYIFVVSACNCLRFVFIPFLVLWEVKSQKYQEKFKTKVPNQMVHELVQVFSYEGNGRLTLVSQTSHLYDSRIHFHYIDYVV